MEIVHHEVADAFQVACLEVVGVGGNDVAKVRRSQFELVFTKVAETKIKANPGHVGRESLSFEESRDGLIEPARPETHDTQVGK